MSGVLILEDGTCFPGKVFGYRGNSQGEVVFNTGMVGYQEVITDPSYAGQIVVMTYPLIGNYGVNKGDNEAIKPHVRGFIVRENCSYHNNWQAEDSFENFLAAHSIVGLEGVDTRALTRHLRSRGTMRGIITTSAGLNKQDFSSNGENLVEKVTTKEIRHLPGTGPKLVVMDFGIKESIIKSLISKEFDIYLVPAWTGAKEILGFKPQGVFLSNGPGDPKDVPKSIVTIKELIGKIPVCGICLGHQLIALALGADTYKLKFGHRGVNHPVKDLLTNRVYITSQNHGYAIKEESLPQDVYVTHRNLNDHTIEGIRHKYLPVSSVQYHPEAAPGPEDSAYLFNHFYDLLVG
ncbi:MAG: carbamoyl-phosphate synthase small subunit [Clostridia bacterium]|jgi:carbamoyl-phosphate synthase small subunit|nr:carbamoyl-phosphate synthase small subunit [Clostridia bacterium]MDN5323203.1 carbamoyl-phosphate synthase small subunit [Clostridia bacterium]